MDLAHLTPDQRCVLQAEGQCGLIGSAQAIALGMTRPHIRRRVATGRWVPEAPRVYRIAGGPTSAEQPEWCAHLWAEGRGVLVLGTAARAWGFPWFSSDPVEIAVAARASRGSLPFIVHRYGRDSLCYTTEVDGLRVSTIPKTVMDLLGRRDPRGEWVMDRSLIDGLCSLGEYRLLYEDPSMHGHRGRDLLRERIEIRAIRPPNETTGERKLWGLMSRTPGLVLPTRQVWVRFPDGERIRYDFAYPHLLYAIEVDDYGSHAGRDRFGGDRWRDSRCALLGWFILRIPEWDIDEQPDRVIETIKAHYDRLAKAQA